MLNESATKKNGVGKKNGGVFALKPFRYLFEKEVKELIRLHKCTLEQLNEVIKRIEKQCNGGL